MNCKSCNTRMPAGLRTCPNCGRLSTKPASAAREDDSKYPLTEGNARAAEPVDLELDEIEEIEELDEVVDEDVTVVAEASASPKQSPRAHREARQQRTRPGKRAVAAPKRAPKPSRPARSTGGDATISGVTPSIDEVKGLVAQQPELLEAGLRLHSIDGHAAGEPFPTDVGDVDLLALDDAGGLVAIMVATSADAVSKQIVGETLQRVGWLSRHAADEGQEVRAIVLVDALPEEVEYAAAAVGDAIDFKTWRVSVRFDSLDL